MINAAGSQAVPRLAATLIVVRSERAGPSVYLMQRAAKSRFMPGAYVFPGGAVDPDDRGHALAAGIAAPAGGAAPELVVAAVRETFEEAGLLFARHRSGRALDGTLDLAALRAELASGAPFRELLKARDLVPDSAALAYYSNWITPPSETIRFDAHFFVARAPEGQVPSPDAREVHDGRWLAPRDALALAARGELQLRFPTRKHLERLARFDDVDALVAHARTRRVAPVEPTERADGSFAFDEAAW